MSDRVRRIASTAPGVVTVTSWLKDEGAEAPEWSARGGRAIVGSLVHRMFQCVLPSSTALEDVARGLLTAEERAALAVDVEDVIARAAADFAALRARPEVVALLASGTVMREVPFSMRLDRACSDGDRSPLAQGTAPVLRGRIDLLVVGDDGSVMVVEFKTGTRRAEHERQLEIYVRAARALFPGRRVEGCLVYP